MEKQIYIDALRELSPEKIEWVTGQAIRRLKKMPVVADFFEMIHEKDTAALWADRNANYPEEPPPIGKYCEKCYPDGWWKRERADMPGYYFVVRCPCQNKK